MPDDNKELSSLTDPVVEDISKTPKPLSRHNTNQGFTTSKEVEPQQTNSQASEPSLTPPVATPPKTSKNMLALPLIVITLVAVVAASLFYNKNKQLSTQVQDLSNTLEAQETNITPEPTVEITPEPTLIPDPEATPTASPTVAPTTTETRTEIEQAIALAQSEYKDAQLILITSNNPHLEDQTLTKYWFRQSPTTKQYLYISFTGGESSLVNQQVYVSPDNNIPSLNQRQEEGKLGLTQKELLTLANGLCEKPESCSNADSVKTQFLDTGSRLLWQITYQIQDPSQSIVFQIDSRTKEVVYQSQK